MSFTNFHITLNHPQEIFYCGEEVSGFLTLRATKDKRIRGIEIKFHGEAYVHWTELSSTTDSEGRSTTETDHYSNKETYFTHYIYVVGGPDQDMTLPPGDYSYPFQFILPVNVPSSFEGKYGHIRYTVRGRINRPWAFDLKVKRPFTVICPLDLNTEPAIQEPYQRSIEEELCSLCCASEAITYVVNLPNRGFVPGQKPGAVIEVDNPTNESIGVNCSLIQKIIFKASGGHQKVKKKILETEYLGRLAGRGSMTQRSNLQIPVVPASLVNLCKCISIKYIFRVSGFFFPTIDVPIIVGTIPLRTQFPFITPAEPSAPVLPSTPSASPEATPASPPPYPEMPPPSYEECIKGKEDIRSKDDDEEVEEEFAPRYPVYHFT